jgi:7,8-dihydropterin-6-yl-methyl-4-(beta-D-ribofuranosyl)aminobenzene 5'-phosphate synthase
MKRRTFLKSIAATGVAASVGSTANLMLPQKAHARKKVDLGEIKNVRIDVLSETSWFDNDILKKNMMDYGGAMTNQYTIPWDWDNAGGYAALITVTTLEGEERKILMDSGWNNGWMDYIFEEKSDVAKMLEKGEIDTFVLSLFSYARKNFKGYEPYGCYGGLHITLFETWQPKFDDIICMVLPCWWCCCHRLC